MTDMVAPRGYWAGLSDDQLIAGRLEYLKSSDPGLRQIAVDIWDDLGRRADQRARTTSAAVAEACPPTVRDITSPATPSPGGSLDVPVMGVQGTRFRSSGRPGGREAHGLPLHP